MRAIATATALLVLAVAVGVAAVAVVAMAVPPPSSVRFDWATVQPFFHADNVTGPYSDEAIASMARFPLVREKCPCRRTFKP